MIGSKSIANLITNDSFNMLMDLLTYVDSGDYVGSGPAICTLSSLFSSFIIDVSVMTSGSSNIVKLPTLTNGQYIYVQLGGSLTAYSLSRNTS